MEEHSKVYGPSPFPYRIRAFTTSGKDGEQGAPGRSGGLGRPGGYGTKGASGSDAGPAQPGESGGDLTLTLTPSAWSIQGPNSQVSHPFSDLSQAPRFAIASKGGKGGDGGVGGSGQAGSVGVRGLDATETRDGTDGGPGGDGGDAGRGTNGSNGGDGGIIRVLAPSTAMELFALVHSVDVSGGPGGAAGQHGQPGRAGSGGRGGFWKTWSTGSFEDRKRHKRPGGRPGPDGSQGKVPSLHLYAGNPGRPGSVEYALSDQDVVFDDVFKLVLSNPVLSTQLRNEAFMEPGETGELILSATNAASSMPLPSTQQVRIEVQETSLVLPLQSGLVPTSLGPQETSMTTPTIFKIANLGLVPGTGEPYTATAVPNVDATMGGIESGLGGQEFASRPITVKWPVSFTQIAQLVVVAGEWAFFTITLTNHGRAPLGLPHRGLSISTRLGKSGSISHQLVHFRHAHKDNTQEQPATEPILYDFNKPSRSLAGSKEIVVQFALKFDYAAPAFEFVDLVTDLLLSPLDDPTGPPVLVQSRSVRVQCTAPYLPAPPWNLAQGPKPLDALLVVHSSTTSKEIADIRQQVSAFGGRLSVYNLTYYGQLLVDAPVIGAGHSTIMDHYRGGLIIILNQGFQVPDASKPSGLSNQVRYALEACELWPKILFAARQRDITTLVIGSDKGWNSRFVAPPVLTTDLPSPAYPSIEEFLLAFAMGTAPCAESPHGVARIKFVGNDPRSKLCGADTSISAVVAGKLRSQFPTVVFAVTDATLEADPSEPIVEIRVVNNVIDNHIARVETDKLDSIGLTYALAASLVYRTKINVLQTMWETPNLRASGSAGIGIRHAILADIAFELSNAMKSKLPSKLLEARHGLHSTIDTLAQLSKAPLDAGPGALPLPPSPWRVANIAAFMGELLAMAPATSGAWTYSASSARRQAGRYIKFAVDSWIEDTVTAWVGPGAEADTRSDAKAHFVALVELRTAQAKAIRGAWLAGGVPMQRYLAYGRVPVTFAGAHSDSFNINSKQLRQNNQRLLKGLLDTPSLPARPGVFASQDMSMIAAPSPSPGVNVRTPPGFAERASLLDFEAPPGYRDIVVNRSVEQLSPVGFGAPPSPIMPMAIDEWSGRRVEAPTTILKAEVSHSGHTPWGELPLRDEHVKDTAVLATHLESSAHADYTKPGPYGEPSGVESWARVLDTQIEAMAALDPSVAGGTDPARLCTSSRKRILSTSSTPKDAMWRFEAATRELVRMRLNRKMLNENGTLKSPVTSRWTNYWTVVLVLWVGWMIWSVPVALSLEIWDSWLPWNTWGLLISMGWGFVPLQVFRILGLLWPPDRDREVQREWELQQSAPTIVKAIDRALGSRPINLGNRARNYRWGLVASYLFFDALGAAQWIAIWSARRALFADRSPQDYADELADNGLYEVVIFGIVVWGSVLILEPLFYYLSRIRSPWPEVPDPDLITALPVEPSSDTW